MRIKQSKARSQKAAPAPLPDRRRSRRNGGFTARNRQIQPVLIQSGTKKRANPVEWLSVLAIAVIAMTLVALIWITTTRSVDEPLAELQTRTEEQLKSIAGVIALNTQRELQQIEQSLTILQDAWKKDSDSVNLGQWRKQGLALSAVADDIFIADERRIIVQGTLPQSVGQGFGTSYAGFVNGSLEVFDADGSKPVPGRVSVSTVTASPINARQFTLYVLRPLDRPRGWFVGASFRPEQLTALFANASLGPNGVVALIETQRGNIQALIGAPSRNGAPGLGSAGAGGAELLEAIKRNDAGAWTGQTPFDKLHRFVAWRRVPGRDLAILTSFDTETALLPAQGLVNWAYGLAIVGTAIVLTLAGIALWAVLTALGRQRNVRARERAQLDLVNLRQDLERARARVPLTETEAATLLSSQTDGVARLDPELRLRQWNMCFVQCAGVPMEGMAPGSPVEDFWRAQAEAGLFGGPVESEQAIAKRLTVLHTATPPVEPLTHGGPGGEILTSHMRAVMGGGHVLIVTGPENAMLAALPPLPVAEPETVVETTEW